MSDAPRFLFIGCHPGAARVLKDEVARNWPDFRLAFSRRGFVTFKLPDGAILPDDFDPKLVFARTHGFTLGKVSGATAEECAAQLEPLLAGRQHDALHVWPRIESLVEATAVARKAIIAAGLPVSDPAVIEQPSPTEVPARVTDVIVIEPTEWWLGFHVATAMHLNWPGGIYPLEQPQHAVSRAYLKMSEAIDWSQLPIEAGQTIAEIGCAPGGASQALLDRGLLVLGIDPAEVEPIVLAHPKFVHVRKRGHEVRRREFRKVRWLAADMNVAPQYTLDTVEAIVTHPEVEIRGLLLTLKLLDWSLAAEIPNYLERIRSWGYRNLKVRQLSHNRQEVCVCAQKS